MLRPVFTHGPGPGPRAANFQGQHIKKIEIEVWYAEKKRLSTRVKFKGDLYCVFVSTKARRRSFS